jgi:hypothetical protein
MQDLAKPAVMLHVLQGFVLLVGQGRDWLCGRLGAESRTMKDVVATRGEVGSFGAWRLYPLRGAYIPIKGIGTYAPPAATAERYKQEC